MTLSCPALLLAAALAADAGPSLTAGRFGKALDARNSAVALEGDDRYRKPPLTVECWAKLFGKRGPNVLASCDPKGSAAHWALFTEAGTGRLAADLPGYQPAAVVSDKNVCDGNWHHLALTFDGQLASLYADGQLVATRAVTRVAGGRVTPGPLFVGQAVAADQRVRCDGLIDELRISRGVRRVELPAAELPLDGDTLGLWRFDAPGGLTTDAAWTPPPAADNAKAEAWERSTEKDWFDGRFRDTDTGPYFNATIAVPFGGLQVTKATAVKLDGGKAAALYDRSRVQFVAAWTGAFLKHSDRRFGLLNTPAPAGAGQLVFPAAPGWADAAGSFRDTHPGTAPLPRDWLRYEGLSVRDGVVTLHAAVHGGRVSETPAVEQAAGLTLFARRVVTEPWAKERVMLAGELPADGRLDNGLAVTSLGNAWAAVGVSGAATLRVDGRRVVVAVPANAARRAFTVWYSSGTGKTLDDFAARVRADKPAPAVPTARKSAGWKPPVVVTRGERGGDDGPFAVDTLTLPFDNPHQALLFASGVDFLADGTAALCTAHGDVWLVRGVTDALDRLEWKRFAAGLYHPLGLKVVGGKVHVLERGQLTRLSDDDGDGEADWYENVCHDWHTGSGEHSYDTCLETDADGNWYFFKTGDGHLPHGGCLLKVSADGTAVETFATGFRHPIGLSVSPDGKTVTGADQEGNWMPATRIDFYRRGGFYGDMRTHHRPEPPKTYDPPFCWLPREMDGSAGGQVWVPAGRWGPLAGQALHLSYGRCKLALLLRQEVAGRWQGGAVDLGVNFPSGSMRGRFGPDGHLYVAGLRGWQNAAKLDGCLQRVRYTGKPLRRPVGLEARAGELRLTFAEPLDPRSAADPSRWKLWQWNYRYSGEYGSKMWSVERPDRTGTDPVPVASVALEDGGKTAVLRVPGPKPVMQMKIAYDVTAADGAAVTGAVYNSVHGVP